jgi:hypothetical protein
VRPRFLMPCLTGGDDGIFRIWDLRMLRPSGEAPPPAAHFKVGVMSSPLPESSHSLTTPRKQTAVLFSEPEREDEHERHSTAPHRTTVHRAALHCT